MVEKCPADNAESIDQSKFWDGENFHWDKHRIGWAISGGAAVITVILTIISVTRHARNYTVPAEQRQIIRILYMPSVYAIISFLSYRFFRSYTYYEMVEIIYEAFTLGAFLMLLIQFVATTASDKSAETALKRKDKDRLPVPFCFWRYRPTKPYFMYTLKWSVMQYVIVRPVVSIVAIVAEAHGVLCVQSYSPKYFHLYIAIIDFISISVALYGLLLFYALTKEELRGRRPLAKFLCIKLIVFFTFYQAFVFSFLETQGVIHETEYWTATNVADGLNALATTIEMIFFAIFMMWAYPTSEYKGVGPKEGAWKALWDSINFSDFAREIYTSLRFFVHRIQGKPYTRSQKNQIEKKNVDFETAFGLDQPYMSQTSSSTPMGAAGRRYPADQSPRVAGYTRTDDGGYGENVRLVHAADDRDSQHSITPRHQSPMAPGNSNYNRYQGPPGQEHIPMETVGRAY